MDDRERGLVTFICNYFASSDGMVSSCKIYSTVLIHPRLNV